MRRRAALLCSQCQIGSAPIYERLWMSGDRVVVVIPFFRRVRTKRSQTLPVLQLLALAEVAMPHWVYLGARRLTSVCVQVEVSALVPNARLQID